MEKGKSVFLSSSVYGISLLISLLSVFYWDKSKVLKYIKALYLSLLLAPWTRAAGESPSRSLQGAHVPVHSGHICTSGPSPSFPVCWLSAALTTLSGAAGTKPRIMGRQEVAKGPAPPTPPRCAFSQTEYACLPALRSSFFPQFHLAHPAQAASLVS